MSRDYAEMRIAILMGGRVAEEIVFQQVTTGAGNDLENATDLARRMVCEWGMSEKMGPLTFGKKDEQVFLGRELGQQRDYSEQTAIDIDAEVRRIVTTDYELDAADRLQPYMALVANGHQVAARQVVFVEFA